MQGGAKLLLGLGVVAERLIGIRRRIRDHISGLAVLRDEAAVARGPVASPPRARDAFLALRLERSELAARAGSGAVQLHDGDQRRRIAARALEGLLDLLVGLP